MVERQARARAYEDFLHRRQDPALLEQEAGNEFSARVFPIPAARRKELIVSYSQELTRADEPYRLPLRGLPQRGRARRPRAPRRARGVGGAACNLGGEARPHEVVEVHSSG